jgi:hypothetical protein
MARVVLRLFHGIFLNRIDRNVLLDIMSPCAGALVSGERMKISVADF